MNALIKRKTVKQKALTHNPAAVPRELSPLVFGYSAGVREWEADQARKEASDALRQKGFFLVSEDAVSAIACDLEEMFSTGTHGFLCELDDLTIALDGENQEAAAPFFPAIEKLQERLRTLSGKLEKLLDPYPRPAESPVAPRSPRAGGLPGGR